MATHWPTSRRNQIALGLAVTTSCIGLIGIEHKLKNNFIKTVSKIKSKQNSWQQTFNKVDQLTKEAKRRGEDVNLIFTKSWFRRKCHLDRFNYDRLVFFNPEDKSYTTVDGINRGDKIYYFRKLFRTVVAQKLREKLYKNFFHGVVFRFLTPKAC